MRVNFCANTRQPQALGVGGRKAHSPWIRQKKALLLRLPVLSGALIALFFLAMACARPHPALQSGPFCITLEQDTQDGMLTKNRLIMASAPTEYRMGHWQTLSVSVHLPLQPGEDGRMPALRKAWETLLLQHGAQSIAGHNQITGNHIQSRMTLRYEGLVQDPIRIVSFVREKESVHLTLEARFAPLAFPDQWERLRQKKKRQETLREIFSVFE
ncbi:hypothetical protein [Desulfobotulus sp.]|jgi:hypothetical protein|uniref:hypothetical protein n=1 Tax=Desulfobotulus sp. TaxID=1940337 RepID=UPI002A35E60C|nr:hypothetical protein [Desulfobotulus sp.]MDY0162038.1 hypothetical protein [Desulfobotulus sp.]